MITFEDFKKIEIKIGKVVSVEKVPDTDKLLKFIFDLGTEQRQIIAGLAEYFADPQELIGKEMPILTNIEPRTLRGLTSHGMVLVADNNEGIALLHPSTEVPPGSIVK